MKQTAVEWLIDELNKSTSLTSFVPECDEDYKQEILGIIEQAKAMEEENTINFALQHMFGTTDVGINLKNKYVKKYNDTFK